VIYGARVFADRRAVGGGDVHPHRAAIGLVAGYWRGVDRLVMRVMDGLDGHSRDPARHRHGVAEPRQLWIVIVAIHHPRGAAGGAAGALGGALLRTLPYIEAAVSGGSPAWKIVLRHILPSTIAPLIVQGTYITASAILIEAALSFLGAGCRPRFPPGAT